jgi:hypothetical protein
LPRQPITLNELKGSPPLPNNEGDAMRPVTVYDEFHADYALATPTAANTGTSHALTNPALVNGGTVIVLCKPLIEVIVLCKPFIEVIVFGD